MVFFFNYEGEVTTISPLPPVVAKKHGKAVEVYTFGPGMVKLMGVQAGTLTVKWGPAFEQEVGDRRGVPVGEVLGPPRGEFTLEGLWVKDAAKAPSDQIQDMIGVAFQYKNVTYRVKEVEHARGSREFLRAVLVGTAVLGTDGNFGGDLTYVGNVFAYGPESGPSVDAYGVWSSTVIRRAAVPVSSFAIPNLGDLHPRFGFMKLQSVGECQVVRGYAEIPCIYKGLPLSPGPLRCRMSRTTSEEPIQTHPRYSQINDLDAVMDIIEALRRGDLRLGITPGDGKRDVFLAPMGLELYQRIMSGNEAYLAAGETWTAVQYYSQSVGDTLNPGGIGVPLGGAPGYSNRNYLYTGMDLVEEGPSLIRAERTWLLSAPGGWDSTIYG
jgi:hypothetical protein